MKALLMLENGIKFEGCSFGYEKDTVCGMISYGQKIHADATKKQMGNFVLQPYLPIVSNREEKVYRDGPAKVPLLNYDGVYEEIMAYSPDDIMLSNGPGDAQGFDTYKLKYGHRDINHPMKDLSFNRGYITSQNHGYGREC